MTFANTVVSHWRKGIWINYKTGVLKNGEYLYLRESDTFYVRFYNKEERPLKSRLSASCNNPHIDEWVYVGGPFKERSTLEYAKEVLYFLAAKYSRVLDVVDSVSLPESLFMSFCFIKDSSRSTFFNILITDKNIQLTIRTNMFSITKKELLKFEAIYDIMRRILKYKSGVCDERKNIKK